MQMKHGLAGAGSDIEYRAITLFDLAFASDLGRNQIQIANDFGVRGARLFDIDDVLLRDDQHMRWSLRLNVLEGIDAGVFEHLL